jgi:hypothetical protein
MVEHVHTMFPGALPDACHDRLEGRPIVNQGRVRFRSRAQEWGKCAPAALSVPVEDRRDRRHE